MIIYRCVNYLKSYLNIFVNILILLSIYYNQLSMKIKIIFLFFSILFTQFSFAQSQAQINNDSYKSYKKVDDELGVVYQKVIKKYANNPDFINALRASQKLWIQLSDAEIKMRFPAKDPRAEYGSVYPMCVNLCL